MSESEFDSNDDFNDLAVLQNHVQKLTQGADLQLI